MKLTEKNIQKIRVSDNGQITVNAVNSKGKPEQIIIKYTKQWWKFWEK